MAVPMTLATSASVEYSSPKSGPIIKNEDDKSDHEIHQGSSSSHENEPWSDRSCRVYVGNLAWKVQWHNLKDHMRSLGGNVIRADVFTDEQGRSKGCGIVEYETPDQAQDAIEKLNDSELFDRKVFVREDREEDPEFRGRRKAYGNGRRRGNYGAHRAAFSTNRGSGDYRPNRPYKNSVRHQRGSVSYEGRVPAQENENNCLVFVGNLPWRASWRELKDLFRECGDVIRAEIHTENGISCGCGTVLFKTHEEAERAIAHFNDYKLDGRSMLVRLNDSNATYREEAQ